MMKEQPILGCSVSTTNELIGGKWKPSIMWILYNAEVCRFGELTRFIPTASKRILTLQLRQLESAGLIHREVYKEVPPKVEYSLTTSGLSVVTILKAMCDWGENYEKFNNIKTAPLKIPYKPR